MMKSFLFILLFSFTALAQPNIEIQANQDKSFIRRDLASICQGEPVTFVAIFNKPNIKQFNWKINNENIYNNSKYTLSTSELLGTIEILSEVIYVEKRYRMVGKKRELCDVTCHAWKQILVNILPCKKTCPQKPQIFLTSSAAEYENEPITLFARVENSELLKQNIVWKTSSGRLEQKNLYTAVLYPDLSTEIAVYVSLSTEYPECSSDAKLILSRKVYPQLPSVESARCDLKTDRIDNACKANLSMLLRKFNSNAGKQLTILYSHRKKAENARKVLTSGELGIKIDLFKVGLEYKAGYDLVFLIKY